MGEPFLNSLTRHGSLEEVLQKIRKNSKVVELVHLNRSDHQYIGHLNCLSPYFIHLHNTFTNNGHLFVPILPHGSITTWLRGCPRVVCLSEAKVVQHQTVSEKKNGEQKNKRTTGFGLLANIFSILVICSGVSFGKISSALRLSTTC